LSYRFAVGLGMIRPDSEDVLFRSILNQRPAITHYRR
jgi:hypothetical protein